LHHYEICSFIILLQFSAAAQSKRKQIKKLKAEIAKEQVIYDSLHLQLQTFQIQYFALLTTLRSTKEHTQIQADLSMIDKLHEDKFRYKLLTGNSIQNPKIDNRTKIRELITQKTPFILIDYPDFYQPKLLFNSDSVIKDSKVYLQRLTFIKTKICEENKKLKKSSNRYPSYVEESIVNHNAFLQMYPDVARVLQEDLALNIDAKLDSLQKNFAENGPNGFPSSYAEIFPNTFQQTSTYQDARGELVAVPPVTADVIMEDAVSEDVYYDVPELDPSFNGKINKWLTENILYPMVALENGEEGTCVVGIKISKTGKITGSKVNRSSGSYDLDQEAIRVVKSMPNWIPGQQNGQVVNCIWQVKVVFRLP
jgi:TonB family protein